MIYHAQKSIKKKLHWLSTHFQHLFPLKMPYTLQLAKYNVTAIVIANLPYGRLWLQKEIDCRLWMSIQF